MKSQTRIMHVDLDAFFVAVEQVYNPELKGKPVVVGGRADDRGVVAAASYEARAYGLRSAMPLKTASRLCPHAIFIEGNFQRYREASVRFMAILADFSPFLEPGGLDEAYLDATGFESLYGSVHHMAELIKKRVQDDIGIIASVGIANCRIVAKIASDLSKPDGLLEVPAGGERAFLNPLPVAMMPGIGQKTESVLQRLGIRTIGQLAETPLESLKNRFGTYGEVLHQHANGVGESRILPAGEAKSISRSTTFSRDTRDARFLKATLRYLTERVGTDLRQQHKQARCVTLKVRYADFTTTTRQQTLRQPTDADQVIFELGASLLDRELSVEKQPVRLIGIGVSHLVESGRQFELFDKSTLRFEKLNTAIDRIRQKYGFRSIQTGRTLMLKDIFPASDSGYTLHTPGLSR